MSLISRTPVISCLAAIVLFLAACATQPARQTYNTPVIDPARGEAISESNLLWFDALELGVEGQGWSKLKHPYDRLPAEADGVVREAVWNLSHNSAGLSVRFVTDSPVVAARWSLRSDKLDMPHMPSTGVSGLDLYVKHEGEWRWVAMGRPSGQLDNQQTLIPECPPGEHEYMLYLPLYNGIDQLQIGIETNRTLRKAPLYDKKHARPVLFWGTSILQGGCASRPGFAYPSILSRRLHRPAINLGFSGNGRMDPEIGLLIAQLDVAAYVIDCGPNMTPELIAERAVPLIKTLRKIKPKTPIVLIENIPYQSGWFVPKLHTAYVAKNAEIRKTYQTLRNEGMKNIYYIPCDELLGHDAEATVDGVHPNDLGFMRMADAIEPTLREVLK